MAVFTTEQQALAKRILERNHLSPLSGLYSSEKQDLAVIWSFYEIGDYTPYADYLLEKKREYLNRFAD